VEVLSRVSACSLLSKGTCEPWESCDFNVWEESLTTVGVDGACCSTGFDGVTGFGFFGGGVDMNSAFAMLEKTKRTTINSEARYDDFLVKLVPGNI